MLQTSTYETTLAKDFLSSDALGGGTIENAGFFTKQVSLDLNIAGSIFPGFGEYDPITGAYTGVF